jgi:hypothetical protein
MAEQWLPVKGYEGLYEVSDQGRVKRVEGRVWNRKGYWLTRKEGLRKLGVDSDGYLIVILSKEGVSRTKKVHQLVLQAFVGDCPDGLQTRHLNGKRNDNRLSNLAWGTAAENMADIERHGKRRRGEDHHFFGRRGADHWLEGVLSRDSLGRYLPLEAP